MKKLFQILKFIPLIIGSILISNPDGSLKTIGIILMFIFIQRNSSFKNCFQFKRHERI